MAKEERNYTNNFKKLNTLMYIVMVLLLILIVLGFVNACSKEEKSEYDVSMMREVGISDVLEMFEDNKTYVLYIGRETCDVCYDLLPTLQQAQIAHNYITQYLDISKVDRSSDNWKELKDLLIKEVTTTIDEDGKGEEVTDTFGNFIDEYGFTPCTIIIKDGKQAGGFFGSYSLQAFENWLDNYGI